MQTALNTYPYHKYKRALETIPPPGGNGCHTALLGVANRGIRAKVPPATIANDLRQHTPPGGRTVTDTEIWQAVEKAAREHGKQYTPQPTRITTGLPIINGTKYRQTLIEQSRGILEYDMWQMSPLQPDYNPPANMATTLLEQLHSPDEILFTGDTYETNVRPVCDIVENIRRTGIVPPHIIPNPLDGEWHLNKNEQPSRRCDAAVKVFRFCVCEFDNMSMEDQVAFWYSVISRKLLPVAALIDSGGKSLHAWLKLDLPTAIDWDRVVRGQLYSAQTGLLTVLGADTSCKNQSRLSRLPGHYRAEKGKWQRLLYLSPHPA